MSSKRVLVELRGLLTQHKAAVGRFEAAEQRCARAWTRDDEEYLRPQAHTNNSASGRLAPHHEREPAFKELEACVAELEGQRERFSERKSEFDGDFDGELGAAVEKVRALKKVFEKYRKHLNTLKADLPPEMSKSETEKAAEETSGDLQRCADVLEARRQGLEEEEADFLLSRRRGVTEAAKAAMAARTKLLRRSHAEHIKRLNMLVRQLLNMKADPDNVLGLCDEVVEEVVRYKQAEDKIADAGDVTKWLSIYDRLLLEVSEDNDEDVAEEDAAAVAAAAAGTPSARPRRPRLLARPRLRAVARRRCPTTTSRRSRPAR